MQLTRYTDYSLRVLIYLTTKEGESATITEIAEHFQIARNHLMKIVHHLTGPGWVISRRGRGGGIRLGKDPESLRVGEIVRTMETNLEIIDCNDPPCPIRGYCRLKGVLMEARGAFLQVLDRYTLADLVENREQLRQLLRLDMPAGSAERQAP